MPRTIRFHLDENCDPAIAKGLRRQGVDVTTTHDAQLLNAPDEQHVAYAVRENRVIFTQDRHFLRLHAAETPHLGIAYCKKDTLSIGEIISGLILIWEIYDPGEMVGRIEYL
jgi:predicted nuclease of predicted toxin-antitoxin system